jgi:hypothetical protein
VVFRRLEGQRGKYDCDIKWVTQEYARGSFRLGRIYGDVQDVAQCFDARVPDFVGNYIAGQVRGCVETHIYGERSALGV